VKVLIAEDNRLMLEGLRRVLDRVDDIDVVGVTHSGAQVLSLIERRRPEVVALELGLRAADGRLCLDLIREQHPAVMAVALSGPIDCRAIRLALSRGARAVIIKSIDPSDVPAALRQAYEETVFHAIGGVPTPDQELRAAGLTEREITMLKALARGLSNKAISQELWVTEQTVKFHLGNLYRKIGVPNRLAAASFALTNGLLPT
jgi:DNA-binding NarL/FixJ family response regulator